jgi:hypothetical protein
MVTGVHGCRLAVTAVTVVFAVLVVLVVQTMHGQGYGVCFPDSRAELYVCHHVRV